MTGSTTTETVSTRLECGTSIHGKRGARIRAAALAIALALATPFSAHADSQPSDKELRDLGLLPPGPNNAADAGPMAPKRDPLIKAPEDPAEWDAWRENLKAWRDEARAAIAYDDTLYLRPDLQWTASSYVSCFLMMNDELFWDHQRGEFDVERFVQRGIDEFGGYDSLVLWHAYPRIGIDQRNQFDFYRDMPGGLDGVKRLVERFHALGIETFIDYNPWDTGTNREPMSDLDALIVFLQTTGADGIYLDTMSSGSSEFRAKMDAVRPGLALEGEGKLPVENIHDHHMSWCEWCSQRDSIAPGVLRDKWFERRHMMHQNNRWETDHTGQMHIAWMNGSGILVWENVFGSYVGWPERDKGLLRLMAPALRRYQPIFSGEGWTPLIPTLAEYVFASEWESEGLRVWTLVNRAERLPIQGELLRVPHVDGTQYYDLFEGREATVRIDGNDAILAGALMPRGLGGFVNGTPQALGPDFQTFLRAQAELRKRATTALDYPGRVSVLRPRERTVPLPIDDVPDEMKVIPGTIYNGVSTMRVRECNFYDSSTNVSLKFPNLHHHQSFPKTNVKLSTYAVDETLVTNRQYLEFLEATGYEPRFKENFLKHWVNGRPTEEQMDHPVVYVDLDDARAYAAWAGKRLLTEEEWQYAAEGPEALEYPWGNTWQDGMCNGRRDGGSTEGTTPVKAYPQGRSPFGLYDMCGNVYEWTESERSDGRTRFCIVRGGSYYQAQGSMWYTDGGAQPNHHAEKFILMWPGLDRCATVGFRCAVDVADGTVATQDQEVRSTEGLREIALDVFTDKVRGALAGQMAGVTYGDPTEFGWRGKIVDAELSWRPEMIKGALDQDDLYVEMTFAEVMDTIGLDATTQQYGEAFRDSLYELWHANAAARRHLANGIEAPMSGHPKYNMHANDIDFQIEADFIGLMTPGLPQTAIDLCDRVGHVMNYGDGVYGGMFVAGMYSAAFFETDVPTVVKAGAACLPEGSNYRAIINDVIVEHAKHPDEWTKCWEAINAKWDKNDACPEGALQPFNIDATLNGAYIAIGMLYGEGDFSRTIDIATRCGQDSDCNPSSAAGILGAMYGFNALDPEWVGYIEEIADKDFFYTKYSFNSFVDSTIARAEEAVTRAGGFVQSGKLYIPHQEPVPPPLEQWSMGVPVKQYLHDDTAWTWQGDWETRPYRSYYAPASKISYAGGNEATLEFEGNAIAIVGMLQHRYGGMVDIYLDGEKVATVNAYTPKDTTDKDLWHAYGLAGGPHTLRIVTLEEKDPRAKGRWIRIEYAIAFKDEE